MNTFKCPTCGNDLAEDPKHAGKVLCYTCKKRYDAEKIKIYWRNRTAYYKKEEERLKRQDKDAVDELANAMASCCEEAGTQSNEPPLADKTAPAILSRLSEYEGSDLDAVLEELLALVRVDTEKTSEDDAAAHLQTSESAGIEKTVGQDHVGFDEKDKSAEHLVRQPQATGSIGLEDGKPEAQPYPQFDFTIEPPMPQEPSFEERAEEDSFEELDEKSFSGSKWQSSATQPVFSELEELPASGGEQALEERPRDVRGRPRAGAAERNVAPAELGGQASYSIPQSGRVEPAPAFHATLPVGTPTFLMFDRVDSARGGQAAYSVSKPGREEPMPAQHAKSPGAGASVPTADRSPVQPQGHAAYRVPEPGRERQVAPQHAKSPADRAPASVADRATAGQQDHAAYRAPEPVKGRAASPAHAKPPAGRPSPSIAEALEEPPVVQDMQEAPRKSGTMGVIAALFGLASLVACFVPSAHIVAIALGVVAVGLGALTVLRAKRGQSGGFVIGLCGLVLGFAAAVASVLLGFVLIGAEEPPVQSDDSNPPVQANVGNGEASPIPVAPEHLVGSAEGAWKDPSFKLDGQEFKFYEINLRDFVDRLQLKIADGYSMETEVGAYENTYLFMTSEKFANLIVAVDVDNNSDEVRQAADCPVASVTIASSDNTVEGMPQMELPGGVMYGMTTDEVKQIYGEPSDVQLPTNEELKYVTYLYSDGDGLFAPVRLTFANGEGAQLSEILFESPQMWD